MSETRTQDSPVALDGNGVASLLEVGAVVAFLFLYIWVLEPKSQAYAAPGFAMFFTFTFLLHLKHNDTAAELGIRLDTFGRAAREALIVIAPTLVLAGVLGTRLGGG